MGNCALGIAAAAATEGVAAGVAITACGTMAVSGIKAMLVSLIEVSGCLI